MEAIIDQVQALAAKADEAGRARLLDDLRDLQGRVESPQDTFFRLLNSQLELAVIYLGSELGLFAELAKDGTDAITATELAGRLGASPELLERILRYLASVGYMENTGPNQYKANKATHMCALPMIRPGLIHAFDIMGPAIQASPSFFAETKYQDISNTRNTPFQKAFKTDLAAFEWISQQPRLFTTMQQVMTMMQGSEWLVEFKTLDNAARALEEEKALQEESERPFFVDVGGGHGHQLVQLRDKYPHLKGRLVLQDLPEAVEKLPSIEGVKTVAHSAQFYYLRHVLHDWPDAECVKILQNLASALRSDSHILIDEIVLPDVNAHWQATMRDVTMNLMFGGKERTRSQWTSLAEQAGLRVLQFHNYSISQAESVVVLTRP
ncbi:uncharacterized protein A1O9_01045 [Exophiala aquamarina CBS 119918]|uniref:Uncharacterized protein n=1 Tax=Exophiala aquamarina CBS 119918 TaxID=1182545 RepID=A0A072PSH8_9EURO|nr:uncharacterized protein A1O9_01045 [Exophiala aquamarina CBS 119918]KEF63069.1 hypothetical protein A1O9_01045 [Exophiala aquamarina CBS 119918]